MFTLIIGFLAIGYCIIRRLRSTGEVKGEPLGMPKGTVRALTTILILSFPLDAFLRSATIPNLVINSMFTLIAFYFSQRRDSEDKLERLYKLLKVKDDEKSGKKWHPMYLPKYSVRGILFLLIILTVFFAPTAASGFNITNTIFDLLMIMIFFFIGLFFKNIFARKKKKKLKEKIADARKDGTEDFKIMESIIEEQRKGILAQGKNVLSILVFGGVIVSLFFFTIDINPGVNVFGYYFSIRQSLFLLINAYYGYRD